jgi:hypothetical protein
MKSNFVFKAEGDVVEDLTLGYTARSTMFGVQLHIYRYAYV